MPVNGASILGRCCSLFGLAQRLWGPRAPLYRRGPRGQNGLRGDRVAHHRHDWHANWEISASISQRWLRQSKTPLVRNGQ